MSTRADLVEGIIEKSGTGKILFPGTASQVRKSKATTILHVERIDRTAGFYQAFVGKAGIITTGVWWMVRAAIVDRLMLICLF